MIMGWFDASEAAKIGVELADQFAPQQVTRAAMHGNQSAPTWDLGFPRTRVGRSLPIVRQDRASRWYCQRLAGAAENL